MNKTVRIHDRSLARQRLRMMASISHDMKGPLQRILGLTRLLEYSWEGMTDEQKEYSNRIHQIAFDGIAMVNNMIDGYKLENNEIQRVIENFDVTPVIRYQINQYGEISQKKGVVLVYTGVKSALVCGDEGFTHRVVGNLLSNAIKFSPPNKLIEITGEMKKTRFSFSVRDQGPGIAEEEKPLLFKEFQRLSAYPTAGESTTGLGLSMVKFLLDQMKGKIVCTSEPGKGACFTVTLPPAIPSAQSQSEEEN